MENREGNGGEELVKVGGAERELSENSRVTRRMLSWGVREACELGGVWGRGGGGKGTNFEL